MCRTHNISPHDVVERAYDYGAIRRDTKYDYKTLGDVPRFEKKKKIFFLNALKIIKQYVSIEIGVRDKKKMIYGSERVDSQR